jgi:hypothetical protein
MAKAPLPRAARRKSGTKPAAIEEPSGDQISAVPAVSGGNDVVLPHPEEMRATLNVEFGNGGTLEATARCTPAGLVTAGLMVSGILLSVASVVGASRRSPR